MNYKYIIMILTIFTGFSCAQQVVPPDVVVKAFQKLYPDAENVEWEKEGDNFEAEFFEDGNEISAEFNAQGKLLEVENEENEQMDSDQNETDVNDDDDNDD
jgi:hypothetical protein